MTAEDRRLVRRMLAGDEQAFTVFFDSHFPRLFRFALPRVGGDEDTAEDVVQSALCKAIDKLSTFRGEAALFTWLCTFCRHEISAHYRRRGGGDRSDVELREDAPEVRAALESLPASLQEDPVDSLDTRETRRLVHVALDALPPHYGDVLEWKYLDDEPVTEIAARLNVSAKAAESLLTRARAAFRDGFATLIGGAARRRPSEGGS